MAFTTETLLRIYDDETGEYIQIAPDGDSLGLVEITCSEVKDLRLTMHPIQARQVSEAIIKFMQNNAINPKDEK